MKRVAFLTFSLLAIVTFSYSNQTEQGKVKFSIRKAVTTVKGHFKKVDYKIDINENGSGNISGKADIESVATGSTARDKHIQNKDWFYSEKFPLIVIQSKKITKLKAGEYNGTFDITIKGKSQTKDIPFKITNNGSQKALTSTFQLSIGSYDIGGGLVNFLVGDEVTINLNLPF